MQKINRNYREAIQKKKNKTRHTVFKQKNKEKKRKIQRNYKRT